MIINDKVKDNSTSAPHVVIIGAGFGGLWAARALADKAVNVTLIDKNNYHTFLALLYQVAAAELEAEQIAYPIRSIFRRQKNIDFILAQVKKINIQKQIIETDGGLIRYDYLIMAAGSVTEAFGIKGVEEHAYFLKTLEQAIALKNHIICCFEAAIHEKNETRRRELLTFVIVGGGATGIEYAGALAELIHGPLIKDYPKISLQDVQIILVEAADNLAAGMPQKVRDYTFKKLSEMGVHVRLNTKVREVTPSRVILHDQNDLLSATVVWTAGVRGDEIAHLSDIKTGRDGRVTVKPTLQAHESSNVYVIGDLAAIRESDRVLPMVAQVAMQSGVAAAKNILRQITGQSPEPFRYNDRGAMITIGRRAAGVSIGNKTFQGFFAWFIWLVIHLFNLIGFRNRVMVLINWAWDYLLYERALRFVFPSCTSSFSPSSYCSRTSDTREKIIK
ncbi:MAG TPA: NAD(P)/FAD-dependent oxidoreductase [Smithellaceae bacterium]|nr:NAD(P)/FAD-dependent oxidoreductase [Smithellaceae bacterium]